MFISNNLVIVGLAVLGLAMTGVMLMIGDFLFGRTAGFAISAVAALVFTVFWSALPLRERHRSQVLR